MIEKGLVDLLAEESGADYIHNLDFEIMFCGNTI